MVGGGGGLVVAGGGSLEKKKVKLEIFDMIGMILINFRRCLAV